MSYILLFKYAISLCLICIFNCLLCFYNFSVSITGLMSFVNFFGEFHADENKELADRWRVGFSALEFSYDTPT